MSVSEINENLTRKERTMIAFRSMASLLRSRSDLAAIAGKTFDGDRDLYKSLGYKRSLSYSDYYERYLRGGVARRIVTAKPRATWRRTPIINQDGTEGGVDSTEEFEFGQALKSLEDRLKVRHKLQRADEVAGIGKFAVLLIGTRGAQGLAKPIQPVSSPDDVLYLQAYSEENAEIRSWVTDTSDPRFGQPLSYSIRLTSTTSGQSVESRGRNQSNTVEVHYSHVLHIAEELSENEVFGVPRMMPVWNYLDDLDKISGGCGEAYWLQAEPFTQLILNDEANLDPEDETALSDEVQDMYDGFRRFARLQNAELKRDAPDVADPRGSFSTIIALISGATNIPQRILVGSERGQLASEQDARAWNELILERQENFAEPLILRPFIDKLSSINALPKLSSYSVTWPGLSFQTDNEKAEQAARAAQSVNNISKHFLNSRQAQVEPVITAGEFREKFLDLPAALPSDAPPTEEGEDEPEPEVEDEPFEEAAE